jgi:hypothetical protein
MFCTGATVDFSLALEFREEEIMRFTKILLVCFGLVLLAGLRANCSSGAATVRDHLPKEIVLADGGELLPIPPLMADGTEPPPIPPLMADGTEPPPIPPLMADGTEPPPIPPLMADGTEPPPIPPLANGFVA